MSSTGVHQASLLCCMNLKACHNFDKLACCCFREGWQLGQREDWRFADLRQQHGKHFWWTSFFVTYLSQHAMLLGLTLPLYSTSFSMSCWCWRWDGSAAITCVTGAYGNTACSLQEFVDLIVPYKCQTSADSLSKCRLLLSVS